ncbi:MAG TPA: peroxidase family protein [Thermoleophilaceae bacterium]
MGKTVAFEGLPAKDGFDLPRGAGSTAAQKRKAVIPDHRNDENLAVAQTHLAFIRFHNRVVDTLPASVPPSQRFAQARELVTKHYQWMIRTDYLPRVCAPGVINNVFNRGGRRSRWRAGDRRAVDADRVSVAAFRLGHAMVRRAYNWNKIFDDGSGTLELLFRFSATGGSLDGLQRLPGTWIADFRRLYDFKEANKPGLAVPESRFNRAMRIDTTLVDPLKNLPTGAFGGPAAPRDDPTRNLAFRNLTRARMVKLATGQQMATFLKNKGVNLTRLTRAQIRDGRNGADLDSLTHAQRDTLLKEHAALVLHPARGGAERKQAQGGGRPHRRRVLPPRDRGKPGFDRPRPGLASDAGSEQHDVPHGRPVAVRVRGEEQPAGPARIAQGRLAVSRQGTGAAGCRVILGASGTRSVSEESS